MMPQASTLAPAAAAVVDVGTGSSQPSVDDRFASSFMAQQAGMFVAMRPPAPDDHVTVWGPPAPDDLDETLAATYLKDEVELEVRRSTANDGPMRRASQRLIANLSIFTAFNGGISLGVMS